VRTQGSKQLANNFNLQFFLKNLYSTNFSESFQKKKGGWGGTPGLRELRHNDYFLPKHQINDPVT
jgi:hypothetical protein